MNRQERILIGTGLLLTVASSLIKDWIHMPDFFRGFLAGIGLALEFIGLLLVGKRKRSLHLR